MTDLVRAFSTFWTNHKDDIQMTLVVAFVFYSVAHSVFTVWGLAEAGVWTKWSATAFVAGFFGAFGSIGVSLLARSCWRSWR